MIFKVLKQTIILFVHCVFLKQSFAFFPPFFGLGYISIWEMNAGISITLLDHPPSSILYLCIYFVSLFLLPNFSNPHDPTQECANLVKAIPQKMLPQYVAKSLKTYSKAHGWVSVHF